MVRRSREARRLLTGGASWRLLLGLWVAALASGGCGVTLEEERELLEGSDSWAAVTASDGGPALDAGRDAGAPDSGCAGDGGRDGGCGSLDGGPAQDGGGPGADGGPRDGGAGGDGGSSGDGGSGGDGGAGSDGGGAGSDGGGGPGSDGGGTGPGGDGGTHPGGGDGGGTGPGSDGGTGPGTDGGQPCNGATNCSDDNACTKDWCDYGKGCQHDPLPPSACDDGNACTTDYCNPKNGCTSAAIPCDDQNACTSDSCNPSTGACSYEPAEEGACQPPGPCYTGGACTESGCDYQPLPDGTACDDGNSCTGGDVCVQGACAGATGSACEQLACEVYNQWLGGDGVIRSGEWYQTGRIVSTQSGDFWDGENESGEPATTLRPTQGCESGLVISAGYVQNSGRGYPDTGGTVMLAMADGPVRPAAPKPATTRQRPAAISAPKPVASATEMPNGRLLRLREGYGFKLEPYTQQIKSLKGSGFQSEHLLQDAVYGKDHGGRIPRGDSPCLPVYGRASQNLVDPAYPGHSATDPGANVSAHFLKHRTFEKGFRVNGNDVCVGFWEYRAAGRRSGGSPVLTQDVGRVVQGKRLGTDTNGVYPQGHRPTHGEYLTQLETSIRRMNGFSQQAEPMVTQVRHRAVETILEYHPELRPKGPDGQPVPIWVNGGQLNPAIQVNLNQNYVPNLPTNPVGGHPRD